MLHTEIVSIIFSFSGTFLARKVCREFRYSLQPMHGEDFMKLCFAQDNLEIIEMFNPPLLDRFVREALTNFSPRVLDYAVELGYQFNQGSFMELCSGSGKSELRLEFMKRHGKIFSSSVARQAIVRQALWYDHVNIFLHYAKIRDTETDLLAEKGHFDMVKEIYFSHAEDNRKGISLCIEAGASKGEKGEEILSWLYSEGGELCYAHTNYAFSGNLGMFLWCMERGCQITQDCLVCAFCGGDLEVIKYIVERRPQLPVEENMYILVENDRVEALDYLHEQGYRLPVDAFSTVSIKVLQWMEKREYTLTKSMFSNSLFPKESAVQTFSWLLERELITLSPKYYEDALIMDSFEFFTHLKQQGLVLRETELLYLSCSTNVEMFRQTLEMLKKITWDDNSLASLVCAEDTTHLEIILSHKHIRLDIQEIYDIVTERSPDVAYWLRRKGYVE